MMSHPSDSRIEEMSAEQRADLDALRESVEGESPVPVSVPENAGPGLAEELTGYVLLFVSMAAPALPSLGKIYTPEVAAAAAAAVASVCDKHGWLQGGIGGEHKEEIAAAVVLLPLAFATYRGVQADIAAMRVKDNPAIQHQAQSEIPVPDTVQHPQTVTFGAHVTATETAGQ